MAQLFTNNAAATLAAGISSGATSITLATGKGARFPSPTGSDYFLLTLATGTPETRWEIVKVTARSGDVLTVVRAQEGTSAQAWAAGDVAELRWTRGSAEQMVQTGSAASVASLVATNQVLNSRNGSISARTGGNCISYGHSNQEYVSVLGGLNNSGYPFHAYYAYHSSTSNTLKRASSTNVPYWWEARSNGDLRLRYGAVGAIDTDISTTTDALSITATEFSVLLSTSSTSASNGAFVVTGGLGIGGATNAAGVITARHGQADAAAVGSFGNGGGGIQFGSGANTASLYQDATAWGTLKTSGPLILGGTLVSTASGSVLERTASSTSAQYIRLANTSGSVYIGLEGSSGGGFFTGSSAYATVLYSSQPIEMIVGAVKIGVFASGGLDLTSGVLKIGGTQVVGGRGSAVADATDAATAITQLNAWLARARAHGLIAA